VSVADIRLPGACDRTLLLSHRNMYCAEQSRVESLADPPIYRYHCVAPQSSEQSFVAAAPVHRNMLRG
jgi:hypothetical protein